MEKEKKLHIKLNGGSGEAVGETSIHIMDTLSLAQKPFLNADLLYETTDAGGECLGNIKRLLDLDQKLNFRSAQTQLDFLNLSELIRSANQNKDNGSALTIGSCLPEWYRDGSILPKDCLEFDLTNGLNRNQPAASLMGDQLIDCSLRAPDSHHGLRALIEEVVNANESTRSMLAMPGCGFGGEGRSYLCEQPAVLKQRCIEAVKEKRHLTEEDAVRHVEKVLKMAVFMLGDAYQFPENKGQDQDISGIVKSTLKNYPRESAKALTSFYFLDHDEMPVLAEKASTGGAQFKHHHAIEVVAFLMMQNFFHKEEDEFQISGPILPHYSLPGNRKANWDNLRLPDAWRLALEARSRFDAAVCLWLYPQLLQPVLENRPEELYSSEFLIRLYGVKNDRQLKERISYDDLNRDVLEPFRLLYEREMMFLRWLRDISLTGKNWRTDTPDTAITSADLQRKNLFPVTMLTHLIDGTSVNQLGRLSGFQLDSMTECEEGNLYHTGLTLDILRNSLKYTEHKKPRAFTDILGDMYDICASTGKEKKHGITFRR